MKALKIILAVLAILVALPFVVALFINGSYAIEKQITINKPKQEVYEYIKYLKNQNEYSVWAKLDPAMKQTHLGTDGTVGFIEAWESTDKNVGKGEQEITKLVEGERIETTIRFKEPIASTDKAYIALEARDSTSTTVKWGFTGKMKYPLNLLLLVMNMEEMVGNDLQNGLANLKAIMEKRQSTNQ